MSYFTTQKNNVIPKKTHKKIIKIYEIIPKKKPSTVLCLNKILKYFSDNLPLNIYSSPLTISSHLYRSTFAQKLSQLKLSSQPLQNLSPQLTDQLHHLIHSLFRQLILIQIPQNPGETSSKIINRMPLFHKSMHHLQRSINISFIRQYYYLFYGVDRRSIAHMKNQFFSYLFA